jgi:predicted transposase YbfD/YdcC
MDAAHIQAFRRAHWGIENPIHYVRDVTFGEDRSTARTAHLPRNLATLRNLVIGLCALDSIRQGKSKRSSYLPTFRSAASNDHQLAVDLLSRPILPGS